MSLPSYYHLSPTQIEGLSFIITLRDDTGEGEEQQFHIRWQEKMNPASNAASQVNILTYTNEDVIANNQTDQGFILRSDLDSFSATTRSRMDRLLREDECQTFVIAAKTGHDNEAILCVIKLYPDFCIWWFSPLKCPVIMYLKSVCPLPIVYCLIIS